MNRSLSSLSLTPIDSILAPFDTKHNHLNIEDDDDNSSTSSESNNSASSSVDWQQQLQIAKQRNLLRMMHPSNRYKKTTHKGHKFYGSDKINESDNSKNLKQQEEEEEEDLKRLQAGGEETEQARERRLRREKLKKEIESSNNNNNDKNTSIDVDENNANLGGFPTTSAVDDYSTNEELNISIPTDDATNKIYYSSSFKLQKSENSFDNKNNSKSKSNSMLLNLPDSHKTPKSTGPKKKLSWFTILLYGLPYLPYSYSSGYVGVYLMLYYTNTVQLPISFLNLAFIIIQFFVLVGIPSLAWMTDVVKTRFGRRRPYIIIGSFLYSIATVVIWLPPTESKILCAVFYGALYMISAITNYIFLTPYFAWGIELTDDYAERSKLFGIQQIFFMVGSITATGLPVILFQYFTDLRQLFMYMSIIVGVLQIATSFILVIFVKENPNLISNSKNSMPLVSGLRLCIVQNWPFLVLLLCITLQNCMPYPIFILPYWTQYVLQVSNTWQAVIMVIYMGSCFFFIPLWVWIAKKTGKKIAYLMNIAVGAAGMLVFMLPNPGDIVTGCLAAFAGGFSGISFTSGNFLFTAIQADVVEYDELYSGLRREAQYGNFVQELSAFTSFFSVNLPFFAMQLAGFNENSNTQSTQVQFWIKLLLGPIASVFVVLSLIIFFFFPLTGKIHHEINESLKLHSEGKPSKDPITKKTLLPPKLINWYAYRDNKAKEEKINKNSSINDGGNGDNEENGKAGIFSSIKSKIPDSSRDEEEEIDEENEENENFIDKKNKEDLEYEYAEKLKWNLANFSFREINGAINWGNWFLLFVCLRSMCIYTIFIAGGIVLFVLEPLYSQLGSFLAMMGFSMEAYHIMRLIGGVRVVRMKPEKEFLKFYLSQPNIMKA